MQDLGVVEFENLSHQAHSELEQAIHVLAEQGTLPESAMAAFYDKRAGKSSLNSTSSGARA